MQMSGRSKIEKWLLADWGSGHNNLDVNKVNESMKVVATLQPNEEHKIDEIDHERPLLEQQQRILKTSHSVPKEEDSPHEGRDYSPSGSSWAPTDDSSSDDSDKEEQHTKSIKIEYGRHYVKRRHSKKALTPMHRPNAVVKVLEERRININNSMNEQSRKRKYKETLTNKSLPDSTKKNVTPPNSLINETIAMKKKAILEIKATFEELFKIIDDLKPVSERCTNKYFTDNTLVPTAEKTVINAYDNTNIGEESDKSQGEELNRSDDNVLISNKYRKALVNKNQSQNYQQHQEPPIEEDEWIPIGSGKTLIHKEKFRKVNWKSYTIATRTLLLATFPRRILATHSLTGKRSPAFLDKPAKMCLDPKIVSDIIIEITSKFNVKENLVRSAITTKLADECKMYKTRVRNKNKSRQKTTSLDNNVALKPVKTE